MAQVGIVSINSQYYREYEIETGDTLACICLRYGFRDWNSVYSLEVNGDFRRRYPNPHEISTASPVNLFIPLIGARSGTSCRGTVIRDYMVAEIRLPDSSIPPFPITLRQIAPGTGHAGTEIITGADGEVIITNPAAGDWFLTAVDYMLLPAATSDTQYTPVLFDSLPSEGNLKDPTNHIQLTRNRIDVIFARQVYYIVCPMCGQSLRTVEPVPGNTANSCPNDGFDLSSIENDIRSEPETFLSPRTGQDLHSSGRHTCRGTIMVPTAHGEVTVFWDESRFIDADAGDYTLWGRATKSASIIGRRTWGARQPDGDPSRIWEFHMTALNASPAYRTIAIPSNETLQMKTNVLKWMTVHHTTDRAQNSYATVRDLQVKQQDELPLPKRMADIAYHFVIDANGSIYEGRPLGIKGSHVDLFNGGNVGIVLAGDFESRIENGWNPNIPTPDALQALDDLIDVLALRFDLHSVWTHHERHIQAGNRDPEACPGDNLEPHVLNVLRMRYPGPPP